MEPGFEKQISSLEELKHINITIVCPKSEASFFGIDDQTVTDAMQNKIYFTNSSSMKCLIHHVLSHSNEATIAKDLDADIIFERGTVLCSLSDFNLITFYTSLMDRRDFLYEVINYSLQTYIESDLIWENNIGQGFLREAYGGFEENNQQNLHIRRNRSSYCESKPWPSGRFLVWLQPLPGSLMVSKIALNKTIQEHRVKI
ncbi:hypothetical protein C0J52_24592 [Blattella germanica]|nr:hypothetical protein C0J52_24592 [Blattella germanica]